MIATTIGVRRPRPDARPQIPLRRRWFGVLALVLLCPSPPSLAASAVAVDAASSSSSSSSTTTTAADAATAPTAATEAAANDLADEARRRTRTREGDGRLGRLDEAAGIDHGRELMRWMDRTPGAYFHPRLTIRRMGGGTSSSRAEGDVVVEASSVQQSSTPHNNLTEGGASSKPTSPFYGMYATGNIAAGELLLEIPRSMVFHPDPPAAGDRVVRYDEEDDGYYHGVVRRIQRDGSYNVQYDDTGEVETSIDPDDVSHEDYPSCCATVHKLVREMRLGAESSYGPYVQYLLSQPTGQLPTAWSEQGRALLQKVLGGAGGGEDQEEDAVLQPHGSFGWVEEDWHNRCQGGKDPLSEHAYLLLQQRGWDEVMIPVMDMLSHRNPPYLNTDHDPIRDGESVKLRATKPIKAGDEIYTSYNFCADCSARTHNYGTPEILRDYGFVEEYPQRWYFDHPRMSFDILPVLAADDNGDDVETGETRLQWSIRPSTGDGPRFLREQRRRLRHLQHTLLRQRDAGVPPNEWDVTCKFVDAMIKAYGEALESLQAAEDEGGDAESLAACEADGTCPIETSNVYRGLLVAEPEVWGDSRPYTCDTKRIYDFDSWVTLDTIQSPYQTLGYATVPANRDDMCFDLDDIVQICASYRPHYHEMMVHFAARFLKSVRRVVFVGGGDSMLLHEALKYRDLELVVGLELDQVVPRNSYRYFGTQPHFDDPRVEWWFGDATKSLMMLPSHYFGSFDLVLVDLSETVQALSVTEGMNVMEALALLVKPDGVLVQNEYMHFLEQSAVFQHTMHVHFDSVPIVCSQSLILASNAVDFLRDETTDHAVDTLYNLLDEESLRFNIVRDYQRNHTNPHHCSSWSDSSTSKDASKIQLQSPGIMFIVDAEGVSFSSNSESLRESMIAALQAVHGIDIISQTVSSTSDNTTIITISLKNGYIVARARPAHDFCGFDIHFWSLYHLQESVRAALIAAITRTDERAGDQPVVSSYRIVASGVFSSESWRDDDIRRGPQLAMLCPSVDKGHGNKTTFRLTSEAMKTFNREIVSLVPEEDFNVLVLCGRSLAECQSVDVFGKEESTDSILAVQPCLGLLDDESYAENGSQRMLQCEKAINEQLKKSGLDSIRLVVLDLTAPFTLAQIVARIFSSEANVERFLADHIVVEAMVLENDMWRRTFVHRFRTHVFDAEPVFTFDATFTGTDSRFDFVVTASGDEDFAERFLSFSQLIEKKSGLMSEIQKVRAGEFSFQYQFEPSQVFTHSDYDSHGAMQQWGNQFPLGLHTIFQFETMDKKSRALSIATLVAALHDAFKTADVDDLVIDSSSAVADGCIIFANWQSNNGGNAVLLWDGRIHVDLNLFSWQAEGGEDFADRIETAILDVISDLDFERVLRDEQPRGTGPVVLYPKPRGNPMWHKVEDLHVS